MNACGVVIADTSAEAHRFLQANDGCSDYPVYYIGPAADTIRIGKRYSKKSVHWVDDFGTPFSKECSERTLEIAVDTSAATSSAVEFSYDDTGYGMKMTVQYQAFLFSIRNISDTTIYLGRSFSIFFIHREAKNRKGDWVSIGHPLSELSLCSTGEPMPCWNPMNCLSQN